MTLFETLKLALQAIRRNAMRSFLTILGMVIGVGAVIAMVTVGNGTTAKVTADLEKLGSNLPAPNQLTALFSYYSRHVMTGGELMQKTFSDDGLDPIRLRPLFTRSGQDGTSLSHGLTVSPIARCLRSGHRRK